MPRRPEARALMRGLLREGARRRHRGLPALDDKLAAELMRLVERSPGRHLAIVYSVADLLDVSSLTDAWAFCQVWRVLPQPRCSGCGRLLKTGGYRFRLTNRGAGTYAVCHPHCPPKESAGEGDVLSELAEKLKASVECAEAERKLSWDDVQRKLKKEPPREGA